MKAKRSDARRRLSGVCPWLPGLAALLAVAASGAAESSAQQSRPAGAGAGSSAQVPAPEPGSTVLAPAFVAKLADPELGWPTPATTAAAQGKITLWARYSARAWQEIVLSDRYKAGTSLGPEGDRQPNEYIAGSTPAGYDAIYHRWPTDDYWLQFVCTRGKFSVLIEPRGVHRRPTLSKDEVRQRTTAVVSEVLRWGRALLAHSTMKLEPTEYGYVIRFEQTLEQFNALCRESPIGDSVIKLPCEAFAEAKIRTDGYSFVFELPKLGLGTLMDVSPEKTWFDDPSKPREPSRREPFEPRQPRVP